MSRVCVLGGDGFLGSHLVEELLRHGAAVSVLCRAPGTHLRHLGAVAHQVRVVAGDWLDEVSVKAALADAEIVYCMIWTGSPADTWEQPLQEMSLNVVPTVRVAEWAAEAGVRKVVFPSSGGAIYAPSAGLLDEGAPVAPITPYGIAKLTAEHLLEYLARRRGLMVDIYRIGNAYGARQAPDRQQGVIAKWLEAVRRGGVIRVIGNPGNRRDYVHAPDVAALMMHSVRRPELSGRYNLGTGTGTSLQELLALFQHLARQQLPVEIVPSRPCDQSAIVLDARRLLQHFPGYRLAPLAATLAAMWPRP
jgi:UDP-glucose 4-epimerase